MHGGWLEYASSHPLGKSAMHTATWCFPYRSSQRDCKLRPQGPTEKELPQLPEDDISHNFEGGAHGLRDETIDTLMYELRILTVQLRQLGDDCSKLLRRLEKSPIVLELESGAVKGGSSESRKRVHWSDQSRAITRPKNSF